MAQETEMAPTVKTEVEVMSTKLCLGITQFSSFPAVVREMFFGVVAFENLLKIKMTRLKINWNFFGKGVYVYKLIVVFHLNHESLK